MWQLCLLPNAGLAALCQRSRRKDAMLFAFGAASAMGLLLGLRYRVPALLAASGPTALICPLTIF
jgi:hypothetical protein